MTKLLFIKGLLICLFLLHARVLNSYKLISFVFKCKYYSLDLFFQKFLIIQFDASCLKVITRQSLFLFVF